METLAHGTENFSKFTSKIPSKYGSGIIKNYFTLKFYSKFKCGRQWEHSYFFYIYLQVETILNHISFHKKLEQYCIWNV